MKVIFDEQGNIYHQMMDVAPDPVGSLKFMQIDVPVGKTLVRFDVDGDKIEPIYIDRPLTQDEELKELKARQQATDLALIELGTNLMS